MNDQYQRQNPSPHKEGEVNIDATSKSKKSNTDKDHLGEYVDYEEIKE